MSLIESFLTNQYTVTRTLAGRYVGGFYQPGEMQTIQVQGSLQPTNARELKLSEEGDRIRSYFKFYSDQPLLVDNTKTLGTSDRVQINGESYRVLSVETWQGFKVDLPYHKSVLSREPEQ